MQNSYAKEYYDTYLRQLPTDYKSARWFGSPATRLDFDQTRAVLVKALGEGTFTTALEVGPGDGVWTDLLIPRVQSLTLLDQSIEMLTRAKERLKEVPNITFVNSDFLAFTEEKKFDLIFAIRCFEYFEDKDKALTQFSRLLNPGGLLVVVTKNPDHASMAPVKEKELHTGQISKEAMGAFLSAHGFTPTLTLSATWRFKAKYLPFRLIFRLFHALHVLSSGAFKIPFLTNRLTESYLYVAKKL